MNSYIQATTESSNGSFTSEARVCRSCGMPVWSVADLGMQPIAQAFESSSRCREIRTYPLQTAVCSACGLFQLKSVPNPDILFHAEYPFRTATSKMMCRHLELWAGDLLSRCETPSPFVIEIGSNDGTFLASVSSRGIRHMGFEPSASAASIALRRGVTLTQDFFGAESARLLLGKSGQADIIVGANVIAHIADISDVATAVGMLLKPTGIFTFEAIYLGDVLRQTAFDQIYDEHVYTFSLKAVTSVFERVGLEIVDVSPQPIQGGSMRYVLAHEGVLPIADRVAAARKAEAMAGLDRPETYEQFASRIVATRDELQRCVATIMKSGASLAGYGATAKSTTVLNYCGFGPEQIQCIVDSTPEKQGKVAPGTGIPVVPLAYFEESPPDFAVLFAWNHRAEIERNHPRFRQRGGRWVTYVPAVTIV